MDNETYFRIKKFRQFKEEIRGSEEYLIIGIDISKDKHHAFFGTANGKTLLRRLIFENNLEGFSKLRSRADAIKAQSGLSKIIFGLEPTSNYHKPLGMHLIRCEHEVVMVSGVSVKRNRELLTQKPTLRLNEASLQAVGLQINDLSVSYQAVLASICFIFAK
jgi:hypothetical protein